MQDEIQQTKSTERRSASWDIKNAPKNYLSLVLTQFGSAFFAFASVWLISKKIGSEGYGGVVAIIAASQVAQIFVNWTCVALARYGVEEFVESGKINKSFWARTLILLPNTLIFLGFAFLWLPVVADWLKLTSEVYRLIVLHFVVLAFWLHIQHALQGAKLMKLQGALIALERVIVFAVLVVLSFGGKLNYLTAVAAYIASPLIMSFIGLLQLRKLVSWRIEIDAKWLKKIMIFSVPMIPFSLIGYFTSSYLDAIFISQFLTKTDLGIYSVAYQINGILMQFPTLAGSLLLSLFVSLRSGNNTEKIDAYMNRVLPLLTLAGGIICVFIAFSMQFFIPLLFGQEHFQGIAVFWILMSSAVFAIPGLIGYVPYFNSFSATYVATINAVVASTTNFIANYLLIPKYGLKGCAWATVLAYGISFLVTLFILKKKLGVRISWVIPAIAPAVAGSVVASWTENYAFSLLIAFVVLVAVILVFWKQFDASVRTLFNYKNLLAKS